MDADSGGSCQAEATSLADKVNANVEINIILSLCLLTVVGVGAITIYRRRRTMGRYILRQVNIRNFVKFKSEQELKFDKNGVYFLIGQNQSGKTSVFEAIRRCMSLRYTSSLSNAPNHAEDSIVVCRFESDRGSILSFSIYKAKSNPDDETVCLKGCVLLDDSKKVQEFALDIVKHLYSVGELASSQLSPSSNYKDFPKTFKLDAFRDWVEASVGELPVDIGRKKDVDSRCEKLLKTYLDGIVFTFPMRGFGPLQWSRSSKIEKKAENYFEASQRAEVIRWYLERCNKKQSGNEKKNEELYYNFITDGKGGQYRLHPTNRIPIEHEATCNPDYALKCKGKQPGNEEINEEKYYNFITNTKGVKYRLLKTDQIPKDVATSNTDLTDIIVETGGKQWPILKQSEGFLEAKLCSILLAVEDFATVLLEDPGTGMHPQMIDRLCITMTERVHDKVVIASTHTSTFLKPWLIENIFLFSRSDDAGSFDISSGKALAERRKLMSVIPGKVTSQQFANFCYADTIFFVKTIEDQLSWENLARDIQKTISGNSGFQFISIHDRDKRNHFKECCKMLKKKYEFVLDITDEEEKRNKLKEILGWGTEVKSRGSRQIEATSQHDKGRFILRQVNIRNFVKFREEQELKFENNGVYILIGQNQSGKSSVFEAIRRCMSLRYNSSLSNSPNHAEDSIVVCRFESDRGSIFSFSIYKAKSNSDDETVCLKGCVRLNDSKEVKEFALDIVKYNTGGLVSSQLSPSSDYKDFPKTFKLDAFRDWVEASISELPVDIGRKKHVKSRCEKLLKKYLDGIVFSFPMRGIGPLQWSRSSKIEKKTENYIEASQRAEVIRWYLERCNKKHPEENEERKKQDCYRTAGKKSKIVFENDGKLLPILKQSEGFLEAKLCSILLAVEEFATVLLEEPGTGMHPQMIDRLCITMTEKVHDKVVIVSTHNSNFLKPESIENIFHFKRAHGGTFNITSGKVIEENEHLQLATGGSVTREQFVNFCYAETIVVLEGPSDELFMEALVKVIRRADPNTRMLFSGFQFVNMGGQGKIQHFRKCCKIFARNYAFVLDRDKEGKMVRSTIQNAIWGRQKHNEAPGQNNSSNNSEKEGELKIGIENKAENATELEVIYKRENVRSHMDMPNSSNEENDAEKQAEERNKFFIWKCKDLEDVFFGILEDLKDQAVNLNQTIHDILEKCVKNNERKLIDFQGNGGDSYIIKNVKPKPKNFKLCLDGNENFEDRVTLLDFLLNTFEPRWKTMDVNEGAGTDPSETEGTVKGNEDLIRIHDFLRKLDIRQGRTTSN